MDQSDQTISLDSDESRRITDREWIAERVGWFVIAAILVAAILGLLGPGPLSHQQAVSDDGKLIVEYDSVQRYGAPAELRIRFKREFADQKGIRLSISREFTDFTKVESITPEPESSEMGEKAIIYSFRAQTIPADTTIVWRYQHDTFGRLHYKIGLEKGSTVEVSNFVLP